MPSLGEGKEEQFLGSRADSLPEDGPAVGATFVSILRREVIG